MIRGILRDKIKEFLLYGKKLDLNGLELTYVELKKILKNIPNEHIMELDIGNNDIHDLSLEDVPNIEILHCHANNITNFPVFPKLKELYCMRNNIFSLPSFPNIVKIHCTDNFITHIPTMPNLKEIRINNNPVRSIDFQPNLEKIYISMNVIQELPILPKLKQIIVRKFDRFMSYHFLEDTTNLLSCVVAQKIKYLNLYIHTVKMQRRFRRNFYKKIFKNKINNDIINIISKFLTS